MTEPNNNAHTSAELTLAGYLFDIEQSTDIASLEAAIQAPFKHSFRGRQWRQISDARIKKGLALVSQHPLGEFVPRFTGERSRLLILCGQQCRVGRGQNSTGVRYVWHYAGEWAKDVLSGEGFSMRAAHRLWGSDWATYPHRSLAIVEEALAGRIPDPPIGRLIKHERTSYGRPIKYTVEENNNEKWWRRAMRSCDCGGTLFDWGSGHSEGFDFVNWHCNGCPDVFTEYFGAAGLRDLRAAAKQEPASMTASGAMLDGREWREMPGEAAR